MTRKEFMEYKHWNLDNYKEYIKGFWNVESWCKNLDRPVSVFDLVGEMRFFELNREYNRLYKEDDEIGSLYDWLERDATEEDVKRYLKLNV